MSRESFLARVREAAAAGRRYRVRDIDNLDESAGYVGGGDDLPTRLAEEIVSAGGQAHLVDGLDAAAERLRGLLIELAPKAVLCWRHAVLERLGLPKLLGEMNIDAIDHARLAALNESQRRQAVLAAEIGITSTTYAVAESGTLALASAPGSERLTSLLPPVHVAVVQSDQILADLFDLFRRMKTGAIDALPTNLTLVTGPSKTGDLELRLTTGVHGPGRWEVIIIRSHGV
jgi:L-lactate dehydrogenase complex protein LldG